MRRGKRSLLLFIGPIELRCYRLHRRIGFGEIAIGQYVHRPDIDRVSLVIEREVLAEDRRHFRVELYDFDVNDGSEGVRIARAAVVGTAGRSSGAEEPAVIAAVAACLLLVGGGFLLLRRTTTWRMWTMRAPGRAGR